MFHHASHSALNLLMVLAPLGRQNEGDYPYSPHRYGRTCKGCKYISGHSLNCTNGKQVSARFDPGLQELLERDHSTSTSGHMYLPDYPDRRLTDVHHSNSGHMPHLPCEAQAVQCCVYTGPTQILSLGSLSTICSVILSPRQPIESLLHFIMVD